MKKISNKIEKKIIQLYKQHTPSYKISKRLNISNDSVLRILDKYDVEIRVYLLGFLYQNGSVTKDEYSNSLRRVL